MNKMNENRHVAKVVKVQSNIFQSILTLDLKDQLSFIILLTLFWLFCYTSAIALINLFLGLQVLVSLPIFRKTVVRATNRIHKIAASSDQCIKLHILTQFSSNVQIPIYSSVHNLIWRKSKYNYRSTVKSWSQWLH